MHFFARPEKGPLSLFSLLSLRQSFLAVAGRGKKGWGGKGGKDFCSAVEKRGKRTALLPWASVARGSARPPARGRREDGPGMKNSQPLSIGQVSTLVVRAGKRCEVSSDKKQVHSGPLVYTYFALEGGGAVGIKQVYFHESSFNGSSSTFRKLRIPALLFFFFVRVLAGLATARLGKACEKPCLCVGKNSSVARFRHWPIYFAKEKFCMIFSRKYYLTMWCQQSKSTHSSHMFVHTIVCILDVQ